MRRFLFVTSLVFAVGLTACNNGQNQTAQNQPANVTSGNPSDGNLAPADSGTPPVAASGQSYAPPPEYDQDVSYGQTVQASDPPPPLPDYSQPPCPGDNYIWTPGYWSYADAGYYWVPGAWVLAPYVGALWTPSWWGYDNGAYRWHAGYWAPHIGYYGGIDYGFGYTGRGYYGAYWNNGSLNYNRAVTNVNTAVVHNVYDHSVPNNRANRVSYNGGRGGVDARPTAQELAVVHEARTPAVGAQIQQERQASTDRAQFAKTGGGHPASLVASRPLPTTYKAPAARPPAPPARTAERPTTVAPEREPVQATRQEARPAPPNRPAAPEPGTVARRQTPAQEPQTRPAPQARPEVRPQPQPRPAPEARPQARPAPQARPEVRPQPQPRAAPEARPQARPAPQPRPEPRPEAQPRPAPQARPEAQPRPAPEAHPQARPASPPRPAPKPEERKDK